MDALPEGLARPHGRAAADPQSHCFRHLEKQLPPASRPGADVLADEEASRRRHCLLEALAYGKVAGDTVTETGTISMNERVWVECVGELIVARMRGPVTAEVLSERQERVVALARESGSQRVLYDALEMDPSPPLCSPSSSANSMQPSVGCACEAPASCRRAGSRTWRGLRSERASTACLQRYALGSEMAEQRPGGGLNCTRRPRLRVRWHQRSASKLQRDRRFAPNVPIP